MVLFVLTARDQHGAKSEADLLSKHAGYIAKQRQAGLRFVVHESPVPAVPYISSNRWLSDCECGAGNAVDPTWSVVCCFGCGAIHRHIELPEDWRALEAILLQRVVAPLRNWKPGETMDDLVAENTQAGIGVTS